MKSSTTLLFLVLTHTIDVAAIKTKESAALLRLSDANGIFPTEDIKEAIITKPLVLEKLDFRKPMTSPLEERMASPKSPKLATSPIEDRMSTLKSRKLTSSPLLDKMTSLKSKFWPRPLSLFLAETSWQILEAYVHICSFVLVTQDSDQDFVTRIQRRFTTASQPLLVMDLSTWSLKSTEDFRNLWKDTAVACQVALIDLTSEIHDGYKEDLYRFLDATKLWNRPEVKLLLVGSKEMALQVLHQPSFRNSLHLVYVALGASDPLSQPDGVTVAGEDEMVTVYSRCLYCDKGQPKLVVQGQWSTQSPIPKGIIKFSGSNILKSFYGRKLRLSGSLPVIPYNDYHLNFADLYSPVHLRDSVCKRALDVVSVQLNFTHEIFPTADLQFGVPLENGTWNGVIGDLQHERVAFTILTSTTDMSLPVMDHTKMIRFDPLIIVSHKPRPLPQYLSIIRPFTTDVWAWLMLSIIIWGLSLWLLQNASNRINEDKPMTLGWSIFYSWAVILEDPPPDPPTSTTGQMLVGWWLLATLVVSTGYRSSLVAQLTVQSKEKPVDSYGDLVNQSSWGWAIDEEILTGFPKVYFYSSEDPSIQHVYKHHYPESRARALAKITRGDYALIAFKNVVTATIAKHFSDDLKRTSFHFSKSEYQLVADYGWGFPKGVPYLRTIADVFDHLGEAGIFNYWLRDVIAIRARGWKKELKERGSTVDIQGTQTSIEEQLVLRVRHFTGVYLAMGLGVIVAFMSLLVENMLRKL